MRRARRVNVADGFAGLAYATDEGRKLLAKMPEAWTWRQASRLEGWSSSSASQLITDTAVPTGAHSYIQAAMSMGRLTQPWLMGAPKLLCQ